MAKFQILLEVCPGGLGTEAVSETPSRSQWRIHITSVACNSGAWFVLWKGIFLFYFLHKKKIIIGTLDRLVSPNFARNLWRRNQLLSISVRHHSHMAQARFFVQHKQLKFTDANCACSNQTVSNPASSRRGPESLAKAFKSQACSK